MSKLKDTNTVVYLHGFTGSLRDWIEIESRIKQHKYASQLINIIGHGKTSSGSWAHLRDYNMEQVSMCIKIMTPSRYHLVGYSMGGRLALYIATRFPESIQTLTLVSASAGLKTESERVARRKADEALADKIEQNGMDWFINYWGNLSLWDTQSPDLKDNLQAKRLENSEIGLANSLRGMGTGVMPSLWDDLSALPMPVKLIVGEHDSKFVAINQEMAQKIPNADLTIMQNTGHACHLEQPKKFTQIALDFLNQYPSA